MRFRQFLTENDDTTYYYRVCMLSKVDEDIEKWINLPGGIHSITGFWSNSYFCMNTLLSDRNETSEAYTGGGGSWSRLIRAYKKDLTIIEPPSSAKKGHNSKYDDGEVFVTKCLSYEILQDGKWSKR